MNELGLLDAQGHLERLEDVLKKWLLKKIKNEEFAAQTTIELLQARRIISNLISKSME